MKKTLYEARIKYPNSLTCWDYKTNLKKWFNEDVEFSRINGATFSKSMVLAVIEFDKDHCIYVLVPEDIFTVIKEKK